MTQPGRWCVEVQKNNSMRFSPVLFAVLTASAAVGLARPATAKSADVTDTERENVDQIEMATNLNGDSVVQNRRAQETLARETLARETLVAQRNPVSDRSIAPPQRIEPQVAPVEPVSTSQQAQAPVGQPNEPGSLDRQTEPPSQPATPEFEITPPPSPSQPGQNQPTQNQPTQNQPLNPGLPTAPTNEPQPQFTFPAAPGTTPPGTPTTPGTTPPGTIAPGTPTPTTPGTQPSPGTAPATPPGTPTTPGATQPTEEPRVLVGEVVVSGAPTPELENTVYQAAQTEPGRTTTRSQLQADINAIFATGFFSNVRAIPEDTPLGVRITFEVQANPELRAVRIEGSRVDEVRYQDREVPIQTAVDQIFRPQYGRILNLRDFQAGVQQLNQIYQDNGYVLAQVVEAPQVGQDGTVRLQVAEGEIEDIQIRFLNRDGDAVDDEGEPIRGRTRDFIITREFETEPGDIFNRNQIQSDLQRAFNLGIFEDLTLSLNPGQDPRKVDVVVNVTERQTGSIGATFGLSTSSGLFGALSLQENNLGGNNQKLGAQVQVGERDLLFDLSFTDPWIAGDPNRTSYTINGFGRQSISLVFDGGDREVTLPGDDDDDDNNPFNDGDRPRVRRYGGGISFSRPLDDGWRASLGLQYQNVSIRDLDGEITPRDSRGNLLSFDEDGTDNLLSLQFAASRSRVNNTLSPTQGSFLRFSGEQTIPIDGITFTRLRGSYSYYIPVRLTRFTEGCRPDDRPPAVREAEGERPRECNQALAFNVQAGTIIGDLPPYEAFALGGDDSVRGYGPGDLGAGRSFLQGTVEYRFPLISIVNGVLFFDAATDLGTGDNVPGNPAGERDKPGSGFGYGAGLRINSPIGQIRVDYGISDQGDNRFSFGIGERF